jgi:hypothetical protein
VVVTIDRKEDTRIGSMSVAGMKWAGGIGSPRPGAAASRAIARIAISALWLTAGIGEAAVAADGVTPVGRYESKRDSDGPCGPYSVELWRAAEELRSGRRIAIFP